MFDTKYLQEHISKKAKGTKVKACTNTGCIVNNIMKGEKVKIKY